MKMTRIADGGMPAAAGEFSWSLSRSHLRLVVPGGMFVNLPVIHGETSTPEAWAWDGNEDAPNVTPSLDVTTSRTDGRPGQRWHGWVRHGELVEA